MVSYDVLGNIAILKFKEGIKLGEKKKQAKSLMLERPNITTVLEKTEKVKGRLRTIKTRLLAGENTKEAVYKENGCVFKLNVESCYFSPRLSSERLEIAGKCRKFERILVLFAGVSPFSIVIAKVSGAKVVSVELGRECCKYGKENVKLNRGDVEIVQGDVKKLKKLIKLEKFDRIVMPRPQLKDTFLEYVWPYSRKGTEIYYYDFGDDAEEILEKVSREAKKARRKIKILNVKKAGDIAPFRYRWRIDMRVLN
jgi:tRNA (guanine37-N1)-methyltransferase